MRIMEDDIRRQSLDDPLVLQAIIRCHSLLRIPFQALADEVDEGWVWHFTKFVHDVSESLFLLLLGQYF